MKGNAMKYVLPLLLLGAYALAHEGHDHGSEPPAYVFLRGDPTGDGRIDIDDALFTLRHLYHPNCYGFCADAGDFDADGYLTMTDAISMLQYAFGGGAAPSAPFPSCGAPTETSIGCKLVPTCI